MSSRSLIGLADAMRPGGCFVVGGAGFQASVQDADQTVSDVAKRGEVVDVAGSQLVVESAHAGRCLHCRDHLAEQGIDQSVVVHEPGVDGLLFARGAGDRG